MKTGIGITIISFGFFLLIFSRLAVDFANGELVDEVAYIIVSTIASIGMTMGGLFISTSEKVDK